MEFGALKGHPGRAVIAGQTGLTARVTGQVDPADQEGAVHLVPTEEPAGQAAGVVQLTGMARPVEMAGRESKGRTDEMERTDERPVKPQITEPDYSSPAVAEVVQAAPVEEHLVAPAALAVAAVAVVAVVAPTRTMT